MGKLKTWLDHLIPDKYWLEKRFEKVMGYPLNIENPKTFNEKLQWLKLYDRRPEYTKMVDKYEVKKLIAEKIGEEYLIPTLGVWNRFEDIDFDKLPNQFVLKCTHDSGGFVICKDKNPVTIQKAKKKLSYHMKRNHFWYGREWAYKNVKPRIIAEKLMEDSENPDKAIVDYKFFCFDGYAESVMVCTERETGTPKFYFFDKDWHLKRYNKRGEIVPQNFTLPMPNKMIEMFEIAEVLSRGMPFVRVDLYYIDNEIFFGELTFYPSSGFDKNLLLETENYWGNLIKIM